MSLRIIDTRTNEGKAQLEELWGRLHLGVGAAPHLDKEIAVQAYINAGLEDSLVTVQLDCAAQSKQHTPQREVPGLQYNKQHRG